MATYTIKNAFQLRSANKLMQPGMYITPETPEQEAELQAFAVDGSCALVAAPAKPAAPADVAPANPADDLSVVPGIGAKTLKKLADAGITTASQLKAAMLDGAKADSMKSLLGTAYDKILANFQAA